MKRIKIPVKNILREMPVRQKERVGQGMEHVIYSSEKFPDRLFKIGDNDVVEEWVKVFRSDNNIFPIVYKVGKYSGKENVYWVMIEKLDVNKAKEEWDYLHDKLEELGITDEDDEEISLFGRDFTDIYINHGEDKDSIEGILKTLETHDKRALGIFVKWFSLVKKCESQAKKVLGRDTFIDAHKYNFGYSNDGKLKCLYL